MAPLAIAGVGLGISGLGKVTKGIADYYASRRAAKEQRKAAGEAGRAITGSYNQAVGYQQPFYNQGLQNYTTLGENVRGGVYDVNDQFQFDPNQDPGAAFRMQQGTGAINTNAAARGSGLSGATLKALAKYGSDLASQEYQASYNRFADQRNFKQNEMGQRYGRMSDMAGYGERAAANLGNLATAYGQNMGNLAIQRGNVNAMAAQAAPNMIGSFGENLASLGPYAMSYGMYGMQQPQTAQGMFNKQYGSSLPGWLK